MMFTYPVAKEIRRSVPEHQKALRGIDLLTVQRSTIPAVTHVDHSARIQTVDGTYHKKYHALLHHFHKKTGCPVIINTSFNVRGEPIVCTPLDAYNCFMKTQMDALVIENILMMKDEQPADSKNGGEKQHETLD